MKTPSSCLALALALVACGDDAGKQAEPVEDGGAAAEDAGRRPDASTTRPDGAVDPDDFCLTRPALPFCEDFDVAALPGAFARMSGAAAFSIDGITPKSKPRSLLLTADPAAGATLDARLVSSAFQAGKKLRSLAFVRAPARAGGTDDAPLRLTSMQFTTPAGSYRYSLATNDKGEWFGEELHVPAGGGAPISKRTAPFRGLPDDEWMPVRLNVDGPTPDASSLSILIGTDTVATMPVVPIGAELAPTFSLGLDGATPAQPWAVRFDDVTFHFE